MTWIYPSGKGGRRISIGGGSAETEARWAQRKYYEEHHPRKEYYAMGTKTKVFEGQPANEDLFKGFSAIEGELLKLADVRHAAQLRLKRLAEDEAIATKLELRDIIGPAKEKALAELRGAETYANNRVQTILAEMKATAATKHKFNLTDPALQTALAMVNGGGKNLSYETRQQIYQSLQGNQSHLKAVGEILKNQGVNITGEMEPYSYDPSTAYDDLAREAGRVINGNGSVNGNIAAGLARVAKREGVDFPTMVSDTDFIDTVATAAGLPITE